MTSDRRPPYATPAAFRRALTDRLRAIAAPRGLWPLPDLQRQFAYDRLLVRLYLLDDAWILKGATAMLARRIAVRHTVDVDVYRATHRDHAERDLRTALNLDAGDWFRFEARQARPIADGATGLRIPIVARVGTTAWASFHIDIVAEGVRMTGAPDHVPALAAVAIPGLEQPGYRAYPIVDHVADKTCAILERQASGQRPSTRVQGPRRPGHPHRKRTRDRRGSTSRPDVRGAAPPDRLTFPIRRLRHGAVGTRLRSRGQACRRTNRQQPARRPDPGPPVPRPAARRHSHRHLGS